MRKFIPFSILLSMALLLLSCQNDSETKQAAKSLSLDSDPKAITISNPSEEELPADGNTLELVDEEGNPEALGEPELIEFYVEEKKKEEKAKKEAAKTDKKAKGAEKAEESKVAVNTKPAEKKPVKKKPVVKKAMAKMTFDETVFQFGRIKPGEIIEHKFEFTNTGKADLLVKDAKVTCGCTHPSYPFIPIKPGEKGYIGVRYDSSGKLGSQKPQITLITNGSPSTIKIYLEGLVIGEMAKQ